MKKVILLLLTALTSSFIFAASVKTAEEKIASIELYKQVVASSKNGQSFSADEISTINSMYADLEKEEYTASTKDGTLNYVVEEYDTEETKWPVKLTGSFFGGNIIIDQYIDLLYSTMMERKFVAENEMTEYQRRDYEYYVADYESKFRSRTEIIYFELSFTIQHWDKASQYRFHPTELRVYKISKSDRVILSMTNMNSETWIVTPATEHRTQKEINNDQQKNKRILYAESRQSTKKQTVQEPPSKPRKGRRTAYVSLVTNQEKLNSDDLKYTKITLDSFDATLTFGFMDYLFAGAEFSFDLTETERTSVYSFGGLLGASVNITPYFLPYLVFGASVRTDDKTVLKAGGGLDVKIGHVMFNMAYNYNRRKSLNSSIDTSPWELTKYHSLSTGIGITW